MSTGVNSTNPMSFFPLSNLSACMKPESCFEIDLGRIPVDDDLGSESHAGQHHQHLALGCILGFIQDHKGIFQSTSTHIGHRSDLDDALLDVFLNLLIAQQVIQSVIQGSKIGIDFFLSGRREENPRIRRLRPQDASRQSA